MKKAWAYYNEFDPFAAAWLRELIKAGHIAPGEVDERSIEDVVPTDLMGFTQCHFFAGIGVWSYALRCAGWPDDRPIWTGSCPCPPFLDQLPRQANLAGWTTPSATDDHRGGTITENMTGSSLVQLSTLAGWATPTTNSNPQPESPRGLQTIAGQASLAGWNTPATSDGNGGKRPHPDTTMAGQHPSDIGRERGQAPTPGHHDGGATPQRQEGQHGAGLSVAHRLPEDHPGPTNGFWRDSDWLLCRDGKFRPVEPGTLPLVNGAAARVGRLRGYGNALNKEQAQAFIEAVMPLLDMGGM